MFGNPNVERLAEERDYNGLYQCLEHSDAMVRLQAAQVLADLNDGAGWRFLMDTVRQGSDMEERAVAAAMLGELGHPRAVPVLAEAVAKVRLNPQAGLLMTAIRDALEAIGTRDAEDALREAGFEPVLPMQSHTVIEYASHYTPPVMPRSGDIRFRSPEEHLNNAVELREAELTERGLVEANIALSLKPEWAYAWYLRGVLLEDLERVFEAALAYRRAVALDAKLAEAVEALSDLQSEYGDSLNAEIDPALLLELLSIRDWAKRRDAAAAVPAQPGSAETIDALIALLGDEEREVRHAAVEALGALREKRAVPALLAMQDSSWLVRFAILNSLAQIGACSGVLEVLYREMTRVQERNPVFSSNKDPLLEVEYDALMEIGVRALERTGDIETLLDTAEGNAWEAVEETGGDQPSSQQGGESYFTDTAGSDVEVEDLEAEAEDDAEAEEDLTDYVDEVAEMAVIALERLALPRLTELSGAVLARLSAVPDLTLLDLSQEEPEPLVVHDLSELREQARQALAARG